MLFNDFYFLKLNKLNHNLLLSLLLSLPLLSLILTILIIKIYTNWKI